MAADTQAENVKIFVNDVELSVPKGELIIESVKRLGHDLPIFCYHPRMKPVGMCRMCFIEAGTKQPDGSIRKMPKPQAACTLPATEGLAVYTDSESIHKDRKSVLEFLLINHPLDCPICDRGGECPLQNNTIFYGPSTSRFIEFKRHAPKAFPLSEYVTLDLERCIQCARCVRFTEEISGDAQLAFRFRGAHMEPSTFEMSNFSSNFSGNVIEICPVGALTSSKYRFRARPWDLETHAAICTICSNGCNIWLDHRIGEVVRINARTNDDVNEEWTCDKGKFGQHLYNATNRLEKVFVRDSDRLEASDWPTAFGNLKKEFQGAGSSSAGIIAGAQTNEAYYLFRTTFQDYAQSENIDHRLYRNLQNWAPESQKNTISSFEDAKSIFIYGSALENEEPILYLRIRKAWFKNQAKVVIAIDHESDAEGFADIVLRYKPGSASELVSALRGIKSADEAEKVTGVKANLIEQARKIISEEKPPIVTTRSIYNSDELPAFESLSAWARENGSAVNIYALSANEEGAAKLGVIPGANGLNTQQILQGCIDGRIKKLWLVGFDPFDQFFDRNFVRSALENVEYFVFQSSKSSEAMNYASIILPQCAPGEELGTFTNLEGRVQRFERILPTHGDSKPAWMIFSELAMRSDPKINFYNASDVMDKIASEYPAFESARYINLPLEGQTLDGGLPADQEPELVGVS